MSDNELMLVSLHGKCGKLHHTCELPDSQDLYDPPLCLEHDGKLYFFEDGIERLKSLNLDWQDIETFFYVQGEPVKV